MVRSWAEAVVVIPSKAQAEKAAATLRFTFFGDIRLFLVINDVEPSNSALFLSEYHEAYPRATVDLTDNDTTLNITKSLTFIN